MIVMHEVCWAGRFNAGMAVVHRGRCAHVVAALPESVPFGHVPIIYDDEQCVRTVPADDLDLRFAPGDYPIILG